MSYHQRNHSIIPFIHVYSYYLLALVKKFFIHCHVDLIGNVKNVFIVICIRLDKQIQL